MTKETIKSILIIVLTALIFLQTAFTIIIGDMTTEIVQQYGDLQTQYQTCKEANSALESMFTDSVPRSYYEQELAACQEQNGNKETP